jgi:hypothetical protein
MESEPYSGDDHDDCTSSFDRAAQRGAGSESLNREGIRHDHMTGQSAQQRPAPINDDWILVHHFCEHAARKNNERYAQAEAEQYKERIASANRRNRENIVGRHSHIREHNKPNPFQKLDRCVLEDLSEGSSRNSPTAIDKNWLSLTLRGSSSLYGHAPDNCLCFE